MSVNYQSGSVLPTTSDITSLLSQSIGDSKPNDLRVILLLLDRLAGTKDAVAVQSTISTYL